MVTPERVSVTIGAPDSRGRSKVIARLGALVHPHTFDPNDQFQRRQFREAVVSKFDLPDDAHEALEQQILAAAEQTDNAAAAVPKVINLADVESAPTSWLWDGYIPAGALTVLDGDPGEGKSQIALDLAARLSRGDAMPPHTAPNGTYSVGNTLILAGEDDLNKTVKPRLVAAGACVEHIDHLTNVKMFDDEERGILLPLDVPVVEKVVVERQTTLVVFDPISQFKEKEISLNDDGDVRRCLGPLAAMAQRTQCAVLVLRHLNKREGTRAMYRGGGSIGIIAAARSALAVADNPDVPDEKVLVPVKHNLCRRPPSLTYTIEPFGDVSRIVWGGQTELTAADVLKGSTGSAGGNKTEAAKVIIADILGGGSRGENEVKRACLDAGLSYSTYWRARKQLGVQSEKTAFGGEWLLSLPETNGHGYPEF